jgi:hypothetical protein
LGQQVSELGSTKREVEDLRQELHMKCTEMLGALDDAVAGLAVPVEEQVRPAIHTVEPTLIDIETYE